MGAVETGEIARFLREDAPKAVRDAVEAADGPILPHDHPWSAPMKRKPYEADLHALHIELAKLQAWAVGTGARVCVLFEGRDAAGKGGAIRRVRENLNPRVARVVALPRPTEREATQWYFQRYVAHLPAAGEIVLFDRSWYNRAVVEHVFGFCTSVQRGAFFQQLPEFEDMLFNEGIHFAKIWLTVGRAEQLRRFLAREGDPLRHWKLSRIDVDGLARWDAYSEAIAETFALSHRPATPWTVIRADDKRRARLAAIRRVLDGLPYAGRDDEVATPPDPLICGGPETWPG